MVSFEGAIPMPRILDERLATGCHVDVLGARLDRPFERPRGEAVTWGRVMCVVDPFDNHLNFTDWRDPEG